MAKKKRKVQMPSSIRNKMIAATSMLLVSAILMVTTSYAWFTLSTAPEVTGITTSVGANGNLEMALLTTETFANPELITSNTGDSMDTTGKSAATANITWGNLIDLSDASYGLSGISLYPSALNLEEAASTESTTETAKTIGVSPLAFPQYGADGRVTDLAATTVSAIYKNNKFTAETQDYGVRAVGTSSSVSLNTLVLRSAKSTYNVKVQGAATPISNAVNNHSTTFALLALSGAQSAPTSYTRDQLVAVKDIATGIQTSLNSIVNAYANAMLAKAAVDVTDETILSGLQASLANAKDASALVTLIGSDENIAEKYTAPLTTLATAQSNIAAAIAETTRILALPGDTFTTQDNPTIETAIVLPVLGGLNSSVVKAYESDGTTVVTDLKNNLADIAFICLTGGAVKTVADYVGTFKVTKLLEYEIWGGDKTATGSAMSAVTDVVNALSIESTGTSDPSLSDFYGYILDFAFRTNASGETNLKLQTTPKNRVYDDGAGTALQGGGSKVTYTYDTNSVTNVDQAKKMLEAIRIVFFDPDTREIYSSAKLGNINPGDTSATADVLIISGETTTTTKYDYVYTLGKDAYEAATEGGTYLLKESIIVANVTHELAGKGTAEITAAEYDQLGASTVVQYKTLTLGKDAYTATYDANDSTLVTGATLNASVTVDGLAQTLANEGATITAEEYNALPATTTAAGSSTTSVTLAAADEGVVTTLNQNEVKKVSVLVYVDGENIDNASVANATKSGDLTLNLQFSSSAELHPMENNTLKNMDKTETTTTE